MTDSDKPAAGEGGARPDGPTASSVPAAGGRAGDATPAGKGAPQDARADAAEETPDDAGPPARRRWSASGIATGLLAILIVLAAAYISWPLWQAGLPGWLRAGLAPVMDAGRGTEVAHRVEGLSQRIAALETGLAGVRADVAAIPRIEPATLAASDRVKALEDRVTALEARPAGADSARLDALEARLSAMVARAVPEAASAIEALRAQSAGRMVTLEKENDALRAMVDGLNRRFAAIEGRMPAAGGPDRANAALLAIGQLREATRGTGPFAQALSAVEALAAGDKGMEAAMAALRPHARTGVPDLIGLRARFAPLADDIARAAVAPSGDGWIDRTLAEITRIVTIRRVGESAAAADDPQGLSARAELRLAAGDLAGAVAAVAKLDGPPAKVAAPWLADARARLAVDAAVAELFSRSLGAASKEPRG